MNMFYILIIKNKDLFSNKLITSFLLIYLYLLLDLIKFINKTDSTIFLYK